MVSSFLNFVTKIKLRLSSTAFLFKKVIRNCESNKRKRGKGRSGNIDGKKVTQKLLKAAVIVSSTPSMNILLLIRPSLLYFMALCYCKQAAGQQRGCGCKWSWLIELRLPGA